MNSRSHISKEKVGPKPWPFLRSSIRRRLIKERPKSVVDVVVAVVAIVVVIIIVVSGGKENEKKGDNRERERERERERN